MVLYSLSATNNPLKPLKLTLWQPANLEGDRVRPFLFKANYACATLPEAMQIIQQVEEKESRKEVLIA